MNSRIDFVEKLKKRFKNLVVESTRLYRILPNTGEAKIFGNQFLRSASSSGANYHAACRARSSKEFYAKMSIVIEELDETCFWIDIFEETNITSKIQLAALKEEALELLQISSTARKNIFK